MSASYLQILVALTTYAVSHPAAFAQLWQALVNLWQAGQQAAATIVEQFNDATAALPRDAGELIEVTPEVLAAEGNFEKALANVPTPRASTRGIFAQGNGNFRKILGQLMSSPLGQVLLQQLLAKIGSAAS